MRRRLLSSHTASAANDLGSVKNSFKTLRKKNYAYLDGMRKPAAHIAASHPDCILNGCNKKLKWHFPKPKVDVTMEAGYEFACRYCLLSFGYRAFGTAP